MVRIFSLFPLDNNDEFEVQDKNLDFSLTVFMSYAQQLKLQLKFIFQSILYKLFKQGKCSQLKIDLFVLAHKNLAFNKSERSMMRGYLLSNFFDAKNEDLADWLSDLKGLS